MADPWILPLNRGSNLDLTMTLDDNGAAIDMTGWTVSVVEVLPASLAASLTAAIVAPTLGQLSITLPWSNLWPVGSGAQVRIRLKLSGFPEALNELLVILQ